MTEAVPIPVECVEKTAIRYGCEDFGRLSSVLLHRPGAELGVIDESNHERWLFDSVPDVDRFIEEWELYRVLLESLGVEVYELADHVDENRDMMSVMPNLVYMHDTAVVSSKGAIVSSMAMEGRSGEQVVVREALGRLGVPVLFDFDDPEDAFEGCLLLSPGTVLVVETERHSAESIRKFLVKAVDEFEEVIWTRAPRARRYMHPDTVYNRVRDDLALAYLPAFRDTLLFNGDGCRGIDFKEHMGEAGVEIVEVSDAEQRRLACSFVALEPGVVLHYDTALDRTTRRDLERRGVEFVLFHPDRLMAGRGSLRCMTLRLHREKG